MEKRKKRKENKNMKKCPYCSNEMKCRGASDVAGATSWKCRNKKCGRTSWVRKNPSPPTPLVATSLIKN